MSRPPPISSLTDTRFPSTPLFRSRISIVEGAFHELVEPLRDGALDLIIGALRDPSPGPDLDQSVLFEDRPAVIARYTHPMQGSDLATLAQYPWIMPSRGTPLRGQRSDEHTSELQSLMRISYTVFCLKNKNT